jgi:squalene synthase HpnC
VLIALRAVIRAFAIPPQPFLELLYAFEQDQLLKRYRTFEQLLGYCRYSANPVGHLVLYLCRSYDADRATLADHVCTGLQLANFWQDVARDFDIGRVYLPEEDRRLFGYSDADLAARRYNHAFEDLLRYEIDRTRQLFSRGRPLVELMPAEVRADIELFLQGGLAILRKVEKIRYNVWKTRPVLAKWEKVALLTGTLWRRVRDAARRGARSTPARGPGSWRETRTHDDLRTGAFLRLLRPPGAARGGQLLQRLPRATAAAAFGHLRPVRLLAHRR